MEGDEEERRKVMGLCCCRSCKGRGVYVNIKQVAMCAQESCMWPCSAAIHCAACRVYCSCLNHPFGFSKRKSPVNWDIRIVLFPFFICLNNE